MEDIDKRCFSCELPDCINCLEKTAKKRKPYESYIDQGYDIPAEAKRLGISKSALYDRIRRGGLEWALSGEDRRKKKK
ncbi:MAG: hypothetical protein J6P16_01700 [Eubacterium sp.]|nr:hypothetical protein [Eubacterium sp.]